MTDEEKTAYDSAIADAFDKTNEICVTECYSATCDSDGKSRYNVSSMLTLLVQETGRYAERYASDIIISANSLMRCLDEPLAHINEIFLFGIRESGVDHYEFVRSNMDSYRNNTSAFEGYYRKIYAIKLTLHDENGYDNVRLEMKEIRRELSHRLWKIAQN